MLEQDLHIIRFQAYSLASIVVQNCPQFCTTILANEYRGAELGTIALLANIMREFFVLLLAPWMVKYFGNLAPICGGGATTMDTTLPIISKYSGPDFVIVALFHGIIIDFSVPLWVSFFLSL